MAPSVTHQPELLLLHWMLHMLQSIVNTILHHPLVLDPIPDQRYFTDQNSFRLFVQFRKAFHRLAPLMLDITQGRRILQFTPGSPGSHGYYRMDPTVNFPPQTSNFLSTSPLLPTHPTPSLPRQHQVIQFHQPELTRRTRSRSRDRHSWDTPLFHRNHQSFSQPPLLHRPPHTQAADIAAHSTTIYGPPPPFPPLKILWKREQFIGRPCPHMPGDLVRAIGDSGLGKQCTLPSPFHWLPSRVSVLLVLSIVAITHVLLPYTFKLPWFFARCLRFLF